MPTLTFEIPGHDHSPETVKIGDDSSAISLELSGPEAVQNALEIYNHPVLSPNSRLENPSTDDRLLITTYKDKADELQEAGKQLEEQVVTGNKVILSGSAAKLTLEKAAIFAEEPTSELQIISIKMLEDYRRAQADTEEFEAFPNLSKEARSIINQNRSKYEIDPPEADGLDLSPEARDEMHRREASNKHLSKVVKNEVELYTDTKPDPIRVDQSGNVLSQDEFFRAYNFSETAITLRALNQYLTAHGRSDEMSNFEQHNSDTQGLLQLKGEQAQEAYNALNMIATRSVEDAVEMTKADDTMLFEGKRINREDLETERKMVARMLDIRAQGPKQIETVQINPEDEVIRTGEVIGVSAPAVPIDEATNQRNKRSAKPQTSRIRKPLAA